jgi:uncharacterized protein YdaU (DUF1376 family)
MKFYKRDPDAALAGMNELTLEERGAYNTLLDWLYSRDNLVPDNDATIARVLGCQKRRWLRIKASLIAKCKIRIEAGMLNANRVTETIKTANELSFNQKTRASKRWFDFKKANGNNEGLMQAGIAINRQKDNSKSEKRARARARAVDNSQGVAEPGASEEAEDRPFGEVESFGSAEPSKPIASGLLEAVVRAKGWRA